MHANGQKPVEAYARETGKANHWKCGLSFPGVTKYFPKQVSFCS